MRQATEIHRFGGVSASAPPEGVNEPSFDGPDQAPECNLLLPVLCATDVRLIALLQI